MTQISFSRLWGSNEYRATEEYRPYATDIEAKAHRDFEYRRMKKEGLNVRRFSLRGQLRQYWAMGVPCGDVCNVYYIEIGA